VLDREYVITIPGDPATKGSLRCVGRRGGRAHHDHLRGGARPAGGEGGGQHRREHRDGQGDGEPVEAREIVSVRAHGLH